MTTMRGTRPDVAGQAKALATRRRAPQPVSRGVRTLAVTGGKGGVGKTTVAVNLAVMLAEQGGSTLLIDGDLTMSNAALLLGLTPTWGLEDVLDGRCALTDAVLPAGDRLTLLSAGTRRDELASGSGRHVGRLLHHFRDWKETPEFMVVDTAAGAHEDVVYWTLAADEVLMVVSPEPTSLTDAYMLCRVLVSAGFSGKVGVIVNVAGTLEGKQVFHVLQRMVQAHLDAEVVYLGNIPHDPAVSRAIRLHRPVVRASPRGPASRAISELIAPVMDWSPRAEYATLSQAVGAWARRLVHWEASSYNSSTRSWNGG